MNISSFQMTGHGQLIGRGQNASFYRNGCRNASYKGANLDSQLKIMRTRNSSQLTIAGLLELYVCQWVTAIYSLIFFSAKCQTAQLQNRRPETLG